jgi:transposase
MPKSKPPYPAEFRKQMVDLFHAGRSASELSREFGVSTQSISTWVAHAAADSGKPRNKDALTSAEREELSRLRRQVRQLQQERDILAKATAWFAGRGDKTSTGSTNS